MDTAALTVAQVMSRPPVAVDPETMNVGVEAGTLTLTGRLAFRSQLAPLVAAVREIDGVLDVENALTCRSDDLAVVPPFL